MRFLSIALIGIVLADCAEACKCLRAKTTAQAWAESTAVFSGRVLSLKKIDTHDSYPTKVAFEVIEPWKGVTGKQVTVATGQGGGDCGYPFKSGERYLVFAFGKGDLMVDTCTRTVELTVAKPDVKYLKKKVLSSQATDPSGEKNLFWEFHKKDLSRILQIVLDDERMDRYFKVAEKPDRKPLVLLSNQFTKQALSLEKFGEPVKIMERRETDDKTPFLDFSEVTLEKDVAHVRFFYRAEGLRGVVGLRKVDGTWKVLQYDLLEQ